MSHLCQKLYQYKGLLELTKEMILEYQKEQQNKPAYEDTVGDKFKYLPTDINEPL